MDDKAHILEILSKLEQGERCLPGTPYKVPDNYFETFNDRLINVIENEPKNAEESTLLQRLSKEPVFQVPEGYFQNLEQTLTGKIPAAPANRVFHIKKWYKIAAAAVIAILITLGTLKYTGTHITQTNSRISTITMEDISSIELNDFAEDSPKSPGNDQDKKNIVDNNQLFIGVSSQELHNFLNENMAPGSDFF